MVKECEGKGRGLVAAKDIKMGDLILIDKAVLSDEDIIHQGYDLTPEADKRLLLNQKIFKDISMLNHSCSPNAVIGLLDGKKNKEPEKRFELRAVMNISKDDEVTIYYPADAILSLQPHAFTRELIQNDFGFNCRCVVCLGQVPNQDDKMTKIAKALSQVFDVFMKKNEEKTLQDWKKEVIVFGIVSELTKPLYIGRETNKLKLLFILFRAARNSGNPVIMRKAIDEMKELSDKTGLEMMKNEVETWRVKETWT